MDRKRSAHLEARIGLVIGSYVWVVTLVVLVFVFAANGHEDARSLRAVLGCLVLAIGVIPATCLCGVVVGFFAGDRPRKPRDPDEAYPPAR